MLHIYLMLDINISLDKSWNLQDDDDDDEDDDNDNNNNNNNKKTILNIRLN